MKLWILSDLHQEFRQLAWEPERVPDHDVLVAAGDIAGSPLRAFEYLRALTDQPIIYVLGNHEFYGKPWRKTITMAREAALTFEGVHFLEDNIVDLGGVRFLGTTMWTDFKVNGTPSWDARISRRAITDFLEIRTEGGGFISPTQWVERHDNSVNWLKSAFAIPFDGPTVVVTHHAPHKGSIHPRYSGDPVTAAFVSHLPELLEKADLWVHGHVHDAFDYQIGGCRVVCNPRGYPEEIGDFNEELVVELPSVTAIGVHHTLSE